MNKNEKRSNETRENLCSAFIELYSDTDIQSITIKKITDKAGYNRGTFYLYYKDVYDILECVKSDLLIQAKETMAAFFIEFSTGESQSIIKILLTFYNENKKIIIPFVKRDPTFSNAIKNNIKSVLLEKSQFNPEPQDSPEFVKLDYILEYHTSAIINFLNYWCCKNDDLSIDELLSLLLNISKAGPLSMLKQYGFFSAGKNSN